jgi:hypothetical protein
MTNLRAAEKAIRRIHKATLERDQARRNLAAATSAGCRAGFVHSSWRWENRVLAANERRLLAVKGVVGVGLGYRNKAGVPLAERCVVVFVEVKRPLTRLKRRRTRLPRFLSDGAGRRLHVDVVALGQLERQVSPGDSLGPADTSGVLRTGTIGAGGVDPDGGRVVLTAMHVTGFREFGPASGSVPLFSPSGTGSLLGHLERGTMTGVDAAKVRLAAGTPALGPLPGIGSVAGWRPVAFPADRGTTVRLCGAVSGLQAGVIEHPMVALPQFGLDTAILARIPSQPGDSGAALVDGQNLVLGFLVGKSPESELRIFTPAALVLHRLGCEIPSA